MPDRLVEKLSTATATVLPHDLAPDGLSIDVSTMVRRDRVKIAAFPTSVGRLSKIVRSDNYTIADLAAVVSQDQVLSAYILRYANSPAYKGVDKVTRLTDAILRLGSRETLALSIAIGLGSQIIGEGPLQILRQQVWRRSTFAAAFCREMARSRGIEEDEAFLCGLLSNFSTCVALACIEKGFRPTESTTFPADFWMMVAERYGNELGELLAEKWNLPSLVVAVIAAQSEDEVEPAIRPFVALIQLANDLIDLVENSTSVGSDEIAALPGVRDPEDAERIAALVPQIPHIVHEMTPEPEEAPQHKQRRPRKRSKTKLAPVLLEPAPSALESSRDADFAVTYHRALGDHQYHCARMNDHSMAIAGDHGMQANSVVKLSLEVQPNTFSIFAIVTACHAQEHGFEIEVRPMALDGVTKSRWDEVCKRLQTAQGSKAIPPELSLAEASPKPQALLDLDALPPQDANADEALTLEPVAIAGGSTLAGMPTLEQMPPSEEPVSAAEPGTPIAEASVSDDEDIVDLLCDSMLTSTADESLELAPDPLDSQANYEAQQAELQSDPTRLTNAPIHDWMVEQHPRDVGITADDLSALSSPSVVSVETFTNTPRMSQLFEEVGAQGTPPPPGFGRTGATPLVNAPGRMTATNPLNTSSFAPPGASELVELVLEQEAKAAKESDAPEPAPAKSSPSLPSQPRDNNGLADPHNLTRGYVSLNSARSPWIAAVAVTVSAAIAATFWFLF